MGDSPKASRVHHSAVVVSDLARSLRFWRDGLGFAVLMDHSFEGDWPTLFGAPEDRLRSVFLGDPGQPDSGIVELVAFEGLDPTAAEPRSAGPGAGFLLISLYVDLDRVTEQLRSLAVEVDAVIEVGGRSGPVRMATVRDPDGVLVELIDMPTG